MALNTLPPGAFADDAITSDKINLANNFAFTGTVSGAGKIIGFKDVIIGSSNVVTTSSSYSDVISTTYTPSSTSSYLYVEARANYLIQGNSGTSEPNGAFQIISPTTVRGSVYIAALHTANNKQTIDFGTFNAYWNPNTASSVAVKLQIANPGGGQFTAYGTGNGESITRPTSITIYEVLP